MSPHALTSFASGPRRHFGSIAGVFVDRWNRKTTLVAGNLLLAGATLPLLALPDESWLWLVYPSVFLLEVIEQFTGPAENAFLPRLVPAEDLIAANSLNALNKPRGQVLRSNKPIDEAPWSDLRWCKT